MRQCKGVGLFVVVVSTVCNLSSCKKDEPIQPHVPTIQLSFEDASCSEAWLKVSLSDANEPRTVAIQQDGQRVLTGRMMVSDSIFVVEGLLPKHAYSFVAQRLRDSATIDASVPVQKTTMDTTTHSFTWDVATLGDGNSSVLYDVAIINDSLAYAVGEIYLRDSTGQIDPQAYNMAKWNGREWQLMRIQFYTICGQSNRTPYSAKSIFAFSSTDVWIGMDGSQVARWGGTNQTATICMPDPFVINKMWGGSLSSLWAVGYGGGIGHYTSGTWQHLESGTTLHLYDIFGGSTGAGTTEVISVAGQLFASLDRRILSLSSGSVVSLPDSGVRGGLHGIWFIPGRKYYVVGDGMYSKHAVTSTAPWVVLHQGVTSYFTYGIDGSGFNDIVVCGSFGEMLHFNGVSWRSFREVTGISLGAYYRVAIKENLCIAVGYESPRAIVAIGRR